MRLAASGVMTRRKAGRHLMKIPTLPFTMTDWAGISRAVHLGERDQPRSADYVTDHRCDLGHMLYVLEGELDTELRDGRTFELRPGISYRVSDQGRCRASLFDANGCQTLHH